MPSLGETTAMLARLRRAPLAGPGAPGRMTRTQAFGSNPGQLTMLTHRPPNLSPGSPLVVVLHGCTQTAEAYAHGAGWLALADRLGFMVLAPEQSSANNPNRCFNWFSPSDVKRGEGEVASIAAMVTHLVETNDLDPGRVFVTGLSAGGAMTAAMLAAYPELVAAGAVIAGLPYGVARNVQDAMRVMNRADGRPAAALAALAPTHHGGPPPRLSIWHGDADFTVQSRNADDLAQQWSGLHHLPSAPHRVEPHAFGTRSIWRSAAGEALIELNIVRGLGHGTPLRTQGPGDVGQAGPFMLEAGVSSSLEIARFWGIDARAGAGADHRQSAAIDEAKDAEPAGGAAPQTAEGSGLGHEVMRAIGKVPAGVQDTIAKALRAAGLL